MKLFEPELKVVLVGIISSTVSILIVIAGLILAHNWK
jgi:hypothetical protein